MQPDLLHEGGTEWIDGGAAVYAPHEASATGTQIPAWNAFCLVLVRAS